MRSLGWVGWLGILAIVLVGLVAFFPVFASDGILPRPATCLSNVKQSSIALVLYAGDENERFPPRDAWMDATYPYTKNEWIWHCPSVPKGAYGYAFNGALSLARAPKDATGTPLVYDSVNPVRNASDLLASLPLPGRHGRKGEAGANMVAYADGHAKAVRAFPAR